MIKKVGFAFCALALLSSCGGGKKGITTTVETAVESQFAREAGSDRVFFALNRSDITAESKEVLHRQATWLGTHASAKATVEGHCDERGTREYNLALGERRANAAAKVLEHHGVSKDRLETISYGKERQAVMGTGEEVYSQNRRAVTVVR